MELEAYTQYQETRLHEQPGFAYNTYLCTIPLDFVRVGLHWHDQMEIIYIKKGAGIVSVNLAPYRVQAGDIVPVLPGELHAISTEPGGYMEYENIIFSLSILDSTASDDWCRKSVIQPLRQGTLLFARPIPRESDFYAAVSSALDAADQACEKRESGFSLVVKSQLFLLLHALYRYRDREAVPTRSAEAEKLKRIISYVKENYAQPITIATAAAVSGYSPSHFMRLIRQETGQTFVQCLTAYRLQAAAFYLKETEDAVSTIAENCGFESFSYFIRCFREKYGLSPGKYRRSLRDTGSNVPNQAKEPVHFAGDVVE